MRAVGVALALIVCLLAGSDLRIVGDGGEYLMQALNFAEGEGPAITEADLPGLADAVARASPVLADWDVEAATVRDDSGRLDFLHFWLYALVAAPFVAISQAAGGSPLLGFAVLNVGMFVGALAVVRPRAGPGAALLLFGGPAIWWLDKAHTEIFTFSLLALGFALFATRPWWSLVAFGAAGAQNPPIAALLPVAMVLVAAQGGRAALLDRRVLAGAAVGGLFVLIHIGYAYDRHGVASLLLRASNEGFPAWSEWSAFVLDPVIGLAPNFPAFLVAVAAAAFVVGRSWRHDAHPADLLLAVAAAGIFLYAFGRTSNFHHGATPSMSRYALWLVPLGLPLLQRAHVRGGPRWRAALFALACVSAAANVFLFHPRTAENMREPTWLASWLWTTHPGWNDPLPEIFGETIAGQERPYLPVATPGCEKVLIVGRDSASVWPIPCYPAVVPDECRPRGTHCYGNLASNGYRFAIAPGRHPPESFLARQRVWPEPALPVARRLFDAMDWRTLRPDGPGVDQVRSVQGASAFLLAADDRLLIVLHEPDENAVVQLRTEGPVTGQLVDPVTDTVVESITHTGTANDAWEIRLPADRTLLILTLQRERRP